MLGQAAALLLVRCSPSLSFLKPDLIRVWASAFGFRFAETKWNRRLFIALRLFAEHVMVQAILLHEFIMATLFNNLAFI